MVAWWKELDNKKIKKTKKKKTQTPLQKKLEALDRFEKNMLKAIDQCEENILRKLDGINT